MLRVTLDINGRKIRQVAAVRQSDTPHGKNEYVVYDVSTIDKGGHATDGDVLGTVQHEYDDGAVVLSKKMMELLEGEDGDSK